MEDAERQLFDFSVRPLITIEGALNNLKKRVPSAIKYAKDEVKRMLDDDVSKGFLKAFVGLGKLITPTRKAVRFAAEPGFGGRLSVGLATGRSTKQASGCTLSLTTKGPLQKPLA